MSDQPGPFEPQRSFDGGRLDCGSGLALLIRQQLLEVPVGGILEIRSTEPTVAADLPPWCRMTGNEFLGSVAEPGLSRHYVRRGAAAEADGGALARDRERANAYEWRVRARLVGSAHCRTYARNLTLDVGQPASFEERDERPSAVEVLLTAVASDLAVGFSTECSRARLAVEDIEVTARGQLHSAMAHLGAEEGDPAFSRLAVRCYAVSAADGGAVREAFERAVARAPVVSTVKKAVPVELALVLG